ncbi:hypothetical protein L6J37_11555 [Photobacterium sp. WH77]|uniref:Uncharacterized protein n=1 Tax=Photobacterium arenosum TaxID=2774143 RepID=A0ABR9BRF5_9GAMM|nr:MULTISPECIES: hypothetical protein [Photobacterium]MBD8514071.1 hypothetical protein [Photobacterium arenosum]MBV7264432.1 hypothetical protein [Photobacterium sp. WH24]MCG2837465.1 hypothetical protein [Photobacterium sp. WH77]MCG2844965.1 hypothetical protein [Photobacterium sp. WH80]
MPIHSADYELIIVELSNSVDSKAIPAGCVWLLLVDYVNSELVASVQRAVETLFNISAF